VSLNHPAPVIASAAVPVPEIGSECHSSLKTDLRCGDLLNLLAKIHASNFSGIVIIITYKYPFIGSEVNGRRDNVK
jgi:hypothetical protein